MPLAATMPTGSAISSTKAANAAFVPIGVVTVLLGPLLPVISARWGLNYLQAGSLFTAQFVGSTLGVGLSGLVVSRWGHQFAIKAGLGAIALGVGVLPFSGHMLGLVCISCYGAGIGLAIPAGNLLVAATNPERRAAALNLLNFWWSVGAVGCAFLVAVAAARDQIRLFLLILCGVLILVLAWIAALKEVIQPERAGEDDFSYRRFVRLKWQSLILLSGLFFLYVGTENAFGGWIASYAKSLGTTSPGWAVVTPSFFYAALMLGRWVANFVVRKTNEIQTARWGLLLALGGMAALVFSRSLPWVEVSAGVGGLGLAAIYPITISRLSHDFGKSAARAGSVTFTVANFGGASLPWIVGYFSHEFNDLRVGLVVPIVGTGLMLLAYCLWPGDEKDVV
jgi:MFS transporter, FHS family, glucose/mannose:H+ symporter